MRRRFAVLAGPATALALAAPATGAEVQVQGLDSLSFDPPEVTVVVGDTVRWTFQASDPPLYHNVRGTSPNWADFKSTIAAPAPPASKTFDAAGIYTYVCEVHADVMKGTVTVKASADAPPPPPPPPPPLSEQPFPSTMAIGADTFEVGGLDTTGPALRGVRAARKGRGAKVRFRVSEQSVVTVRFLRGGKRVRTRRDATAARGSVTSGRLKPGRYRVEVRAKDLAGNASGRRVLRITVP